MKHRKCPNWLCRLIPAETILPLIATLVLQTLVYQGTKPLMRAAVHYNFESFLDLQTPFLPWTVSIYLGAFLYWVIAFVVILRSGKENAFRFLWAHCLGLMVTLVFFLFLPTTNTRPTLTGDGFWQWWMGLVYAMDAPDNLFPSLHCELSWLCFLALRRVPNLSRLAKVSACLFSLLVFLSTLTTKQHILIDVLGGWLIAELTFRLCGREKIMHPFYKAFDRS